MDTLQNLQPGVTHLENMGQMQHLNHEMLCASEDNSFMQV